MKLFAIVDKSGNLLVAKRHEQYAWMAAEDMHHSPMRQLQNEGYRCIELHTYDPEKQVVVDRDVYDVIANELRDNYREPHFKAADVNKFLKAGEMK